MARTATAPAKSNGKATAKAKPTVRQPLTYEVVDDSLRDTRPGGGRRLSELSQALLDGQTVRVPRGTSLPDKTMKDYGYRLRQRIDPDDDDAMILWNEAIE